MLRLRTVGANRYAIKWPESLSSCPRSSSARSHMLLRLWSASSAYRGTVVPVIELACHLLNGAPCRECLSTRIILVNDAPADRNQREHERDRSAEQGRHNRETEGPSRLCWDSWRRSQRSDIRSPSKLLPQPMHTSAYPLLGYDLRTDQGIVQLITVEKVREALLREWSCEPGDDVRSVISGSTLEIAAYTEEVIC